MSKKARRYLLLLAALIALTAFVGYQFLRDYQMLQTLNEEKTVVAAELDAKNAQNADLEAKLADAGNESFVERMARELLGWVKPGEIKIADKDH